MIDVTIISPGSCKTERSNGIKNSRLAVELIHIVKYLAVVDVGD